MLLNANMEISDLLRLNEEGYNGRYVKNYDVVKQLIGQRKQYPTSGIADIMGDNRLEIAWFRELQSLLKSYDLELLENAVIPPNSQALYFKIRDCRNKYRLQMETYYEFVSFTKFTDVAEDIDLFKFLNSINRK